MATQQKAIRLQKRCRRVRKKVIGSAERPRLTVRRSHLNLFIQAIDDFAERTVFSASTLAPALKSMGRKQWGNVESATLFGNFVAEELKKKQIIKIVFDRRGNAYHGRIQAFAEALRKGGIQF